MKYIEFNYDIDPFKFKKKKHLLYEFPKILVYDKIHCMIGFEVHSSA